MRMSHIFSSREIASSIKEGEESRLSWSTTSDISIACSTTLLPVLGEVTAGM